MSHFIANTISISKDRLTYKLKGGDNNVVPRSNSWTQDIPIKHLYSEINSGNVNLMDKSEKGCLVNNLCMNFNYDNIYNDGSWEDETDYYHLNSLLRDDNGRELLNERLSQKYINLYSEEYREEKIKKVNHVLENFDKYKEQIQKFNADFLAILNTKLDAMKDTNKLKYVLYTNTHGGHVTKITRTSFRYSYYTLDRDTLKNTCQVFGHHRAEFEKIRFKNSEFKSILI